MYTFCMNLNLFLMVLVHPRTQTQPPTEQRKKSRKTEGHEKHISCRVCEEGGCVAVVCTESLGMYME